MGRMAEPGRGFMMRAGRRVLGRTFSRRNPGRWSPDRAFPDRALRPSPPDPALRAGPPTEPIDVKDNREYIRLT